MVGYSNTVINIITAFLITILGLIIGNIFSNILKRFLKGLEINRIFKEQIKREVKIEEYFAYFIKYFIYLITIIIALDQMGLPTKVLKIIFILIGIAIIVFTILAFKDWVPNIIAGLYIYKNNKVKIGDIIKVKGVKGKIIEMNLVETKIETNNNELIFIPNSNMVRYEVVKEVQDG